MSHLFFVFELPPQQRIMLFMCM